VIWLGSLKTRISSKDWGLIAIRSASEVAAAYAFITALLNMPLANVTAVLQVLPLTVTLGAAVVFKEQIGWRRMTAILIGFAGMLLIVRPGPDGFNIYAGYALLAVASVTVRDLVTRRLSKDVPSMMVTLAAAVIVTAFAGILSLGQDWVPVSNKNAGLIVGSSFFILGAYLCSVLAMRVGDISFTAPFRYTGLIWALILGWVIFGDWPTPLTMLGAAIVVGTGLFTLYRERALLRG
jgi:S-adenosylmethionine uptake transporter